jgi:hypothetical protein
MNPYVCDFFVAVEFAALGIDSAANVRMSVARNLVNVSKTLSEDIFLKRIFPLYTILVGDSDEKVRKTCADIVAEFSDVCPLG